MLWRSSSYEPLSRAVLVLALVPASSKMAGSDQSSCLRGCLFDSSMYVYTHYAILYVPLIISNIQESLRP